MEQASRKQAKTYNRRSRFRKLKVGEKVLLLLPTNANKLLMHWKGPYEVLEKVGELDYKITINSKVKMFHINMLKSYVEREDEVVVSDKESNSRDRRGRCAMISIVDEEIMKSEDGQELVVHVPTTGEDHETYEQVHISSELTKEQAREITIVLSNYPQVLTDVPGCTNVLEYEIKVTSNDPIKLKSYPVPYAMIDQVDSETEKMLKLVVIEESNSSYSSSFVIVKKNDGTNRFCIDLWALNRVTVFDAEPMPNIEDMFAKISVTSIGRKSTYVKVIGRYHSLWKLNFMTAFQTTGELFQFKVLPFGMVNSGASFSRMMQKVLKVLQNFDNFVDDILIFTDMFSQHVKVLDQVLDRLAGARLTAKPSNCFIGYCQHETIKKKIKYRDVQKVFGHCNVLMYISYKKTFFFKTLLQGEFFLMNFLQTKTCLNVVLHCDFSIILLSKDFKSSHVKHKTKF
jgi:hypothetical protein